jgi:hypothetical protein
MLKSLVFSFWFVFHPVHVTLTSIDYIPENDSLKVFVKLYLDDFLLDAGMRGENNSLKDFSSADPKARTVMENYLNSRLIIRVNKKILSGKLNGLEIVDNEVKLKIEYANVMDPEIMTVKNLIMTELYRDQSNLLILKVNEFEEGIKLTSDITEQTFKIK